MASHENVYNLIPEPVVPPERFAMHKSKHAGKVDPHDFEMGVSGVRTRATFGPPVGTLVPKPTEFMKSHTGEPQLPAPTKPMKDKSRDKPAVPKRTEKPVMGLVSSKNFITANAVENILSQAQKPPALPAPATQKDDYGKVPAYLKSVKSKIAMEKDLIEEVARAQVNAASQGSMQKMTESDKQFLLEELKAKWQKVNEAYQKLPFTLDTPMRRMRKEKLEAELTQLEKDVETLSRKVVLVSEQ